MMVASIWSTFLIAGNGPALTDLLGRQVQVSHGPESERFVTLSLLRRCCETAKCASIGECDFAFAGADPSSIHTHKLTEKLASFSISTRADDLPSATLNPLDN